MQEFETERRRFKPPVRPGQKRFPEMLEADDPDPALEDGLETVPIATSPKQPLPVHHHESAMVGLDEGNCYVERPPR